MSSFKKRKIRLNDIIIIKFIQFINTTHFSILWGFGVLGFWGYGDICPKTTGGRFTAMFIAIWGSFVISLLIMVTADIFEFHPKE